MSSTNSLPPEEARRLERLTEALHVLEAEGPEALDAWLEQFPEDAPILRRRLSLLSDSGLSPTNVGAQVTDLPDELGDFTLVRPIGGGGMGVVWLANQRSLDRQVALKLIRPDQLLFPGARERFQREVEMVARLHHPGIVPVYLVGDERGLPYFAMEYVIGLTLADVIERLSDPTSRTGRDLFELLPDDPNEDVVASGIFQGSWESVVLRIGREIAEALEHARRRGIVHRDIKPSNVMVTKTGRVLLLDFGLSSREGDARITRTGAMVGSLAYMAPELVDGVVAEDDPRQDVYSLGVTLYELTTLEPAFQADGELALRARILEGDVEPLSRRPGLVSWETSTILESAMDTDPARRYANSGELARDLGAALDKRPITARPPSQLLRAKRWAQRHPARAIGLLALFGVPTALSIQEFLNRRVVEAKNEEIGSINVTLKRTNADLEASNARLEAALVEAREQTELASASFDKALDTVDRMLLRVSERRLAGVPGLDFVRRDLMGDALEVYDWFLERGERQPGLRQQVADVAGRAGDLNGIFGEFEDALAMCERAQGLLEELLLEDPDDHDARLAVGQTHLRRARILVLTNESARAVEHLDLASGCLERIPEPRSMDWRRTRAAVALEQGNLAATRGDFDTMNEAATFALELVGPEDLGATDVRMIGVDLARALDQLGFAKSRRATMGRREPDRALLEEAIRDTARAVDVMRTLVEATPEMPATRLQLAQVLRGHHYVKLVARDSEGLDALEVEAIGILEELHGDFPHAEVFADSLASMLSSRAASLSHAGRNDGARRPLVRVVELLGPFLSSAPENGSIALNYGTAHYNLGKVDMLERKWEDAVTAFSSARPALRRAVELLPENEMAANLYRSTHVEWVTALHELGRFAESVELGHGFVEFSAGARDWEMFAGMMAFLIDQVSDEERASVVVEARRALELGPDPQWVGALADVPELEDFFP